jgi:hypothetical protein
MRIDNSQVYLAIFASLISTLGDQNIEGLNGSPLGHSIGSLKTILLTQTSVGFRRAQCGCVRAALHPNFGRARDHVGRESCSHFNGGVRGVAPTQTWVSQINTLYLFRLNFHS